MPPEQRAQMEAMMAQHGAPMGRRPGAAKSRNLAFTATGEKKTVNGFNCEVYKVTDDGKPFEEDCVLPWGQGGFGKEDATVFKKIGEMFSSLAGSGDEHPGADFGK